MSSTPTTNSSAIGEIIDKMTSLKVHDNKATTSDSTPVGEIIDKLTDLKVHDDDSGDARPTDHEGDIAMPDRPESPTTEQQKKQLQTKCKACDRLPTITASGKVVTGTIGCILCGPRLDGDADVIMTDINVHHVDISDMPMAVVGKASPVITTLSTLEKGFLNGKTNPSNTAPWTIHAVRSGLVRAVGDVRKATVEADKIHLSFK
ncbi:hypothetical protein GGR50DRAFT_416730 [Xylaria sp. CBS 124048]|nr:hypothetical protein GGR50DRAFT_416730 [Xylaria sp. CBS 124048]